jgi:hypothetical protein
MISVVCFVEVRGFNTAVVGDILSSRDAIYFDFFDNFQKTRLGH